MVLDICILFVMSILLEPIPRRDHICRVSFNEERSNLFVIPFSVDVLIGLTENGYRLINCCPIVTVVNKSGKCSFFRIMRRYLRKRISKCRYLQALEYPCLYRIRKMCQVPIDHCVEKLGSLINRCTSTMTILRRKSLI